MGPGNSQQGIVHNLVRPYEGIRCWSDGGVIVLFEEFGSQAAVDVLGECDIGRNLIAAASESCRSAFAFNVLHRTASWREIVRAVERLLAPGGMFFFEELTVRPHRSWFRGRRDDSFELQSFDEASLLTELGRCGFLVETGRLLRQASTGSIQGVAMKKVAPVDEGESDDSRSR